MHRTKQLLTEIIAALFILLFVYAAVSKWIDYQKFRTQLGQSPMLTSFADAVAWGIPSVEVAIAIMLVLPKWRLVGLYLSLGLMVIFTGYIIAILNFSEYLPCSCGGILENMTWTQHLYFNMGFVVIAIISIVTHSTERVTDDGSRTEIAKHTKNFIAIKQGKPKT